MSSFESLAFISEVSKRFEFRNLSSGAPHRCNGTSMGFNPISCNWLDAFSRHQITQLLIYIYFFLNTNNLTKS